MFIKKKIPAEGAATSGGDPTDYSLFVDRDKQAAEPVRVAVGPDDILEAEEPRLKVSRRPPGAGDGAPADVIDVKATDRFSKFMPGKPATAKSAEVPAEPGLFPKFKTGKPSASAPAEKISKAPGKSFFSFGKKSKETSPSAEDSGANPDKPAKPANAVKEPKTPKLPKVSTKSTRVDAPQSSLDVLVELEGGRRVYWRIGVDTVKEIDPANVALAASFSKKEYRYYSKKPLSYGQAMDMALAELGEDLSIVNGTKTACAVYASTASRIQEMGSMRVGPGLFLLDLLIKEVREPDEELMFGLHLTGGEGGRSLVVLYHMTGAGEVSATQITVNPDNLNFVMSQFAASRRLDRDKVKVVVLKNEDLLKVAGQLQPYPNEAMWNGVALRQIMVGLALASGVAALGAGAFGAQAFYGKASLQAALTTETAKKNQTLRAIDEMLANSVVSFAATQSLALEVIAQRAGEVWTPGAKVVLEATSEKEQYFVTRQLLSGEASGSAPNVLQRLTMDKLTPMLTSEPPPGCTKAIPNISGGMNALQVTVTCENLSGPLSAYRLN